MPLNEEMVSCFTAHWLGGAISNCHHVHALAFFLGHSAKLVHPLPHAVLQPVQAARTHVQRQRVFSSRPMNLVLPVEYDKPILAAVVFLCRHVAFAAVTVERHALLQKLPNRKTNRNKSNDSVRHHQEWERNRVSMSQRSDRRCFICPNCQTYNNTRNFTLSQGKYS